MTGLPPVRLRVGGDRSTAEVSVDPSVPLGAFIGQWASLCSSSPPERLVVVSGDSTKLFDLTETLQSLGLTGGGVLRLLRSDEALRLLGGEALPADDPAPGPPPGAPTRRADEPAATTDAGSGALAGSPTDAGSGAPTGPAAGSFVDASPAPTGWAPSPQPGPEPGARPDRRRPEGPPLGEASPPAPAGEPPEPSGRGPDPSGRGPEPSGRGPDPSAQPPTVAGAAGGDPLPAQVGKLRRFALALRAATARSETSAPVAGSFAKAPAVPARERYRRSWRASDRLASLEQAVRTAPLRRCTVVAVVSPKGGVGKTTLTALLGMLFAELRRDPVLALDANPDYGNLKDKLAGPSAQAVPAVDELAAWLAAHPAATPAELSSRLGSGPHGLRFVPTPAGDLHRMVAAADFELYRGLLARLRSYGGLVLVDCGTGLLDPPVRAAVETADQFVLVTDSAPDSAALVVAASERLPAGTPTWLVVNKMPARGSQLDLTKVRSAIARLEGLTVVPERRLAENVVNPDFSWRECPAQWREPLREAAARLAIGWRSLH